MYRSPINSPFYFDFGLLLAISIIGNIKLYRCEKHASPPGLEPGVAGQNTGAHFNPITSVE